MSREKLKMVSFICLILCIVIWIPNLVFQVASPLWILTYLIAAIGMAFAIISKSFWLAFFNLLMCFNFFILMALGYYISSRV